jgi:hypothetical protein
MNTKGLILKFFDSRYANIDEVVSFVQKSEPNLDRKTIIWTVNELVKQNKATRVGRGIYSFAPKAVYKPKMTEQAAEVSDIIQDNFKYVTATISDTAWLNEFMSLQPFSSVTEVEVNEPAVEPLVSMLRQKNFDAFSKKNSNAAIKYSVTAQPIIVSKLMDTNALIPYSKAIRMAGLEKVLVDLVCDAEIYGQYQGAELENIYRNSTEKYAVNYSRILQYAAKRGRKKQVEELLMKTKEYKSIRSKLYDK